MKNALAPRNRQRRPLWSGRCARWRLRAPPPPVRSPPPLSPPHTPSRSEQGVLYLGSEPFETHQPIRVTVTLPASALRAVYKEGPGDVLVAPGFNVSTFTATSAGTGVVAVRGMKVDKLTLRAQGCGGWEVVGRAWARASWARPPPPHTHAPSSPPPPTPARALCRLRARLGAWKQRRRALGTCTLTACAARCRPHSRALARCRWERRRVHSPPSLAPRQAWVASTSLPGSAP